MKKLNRAFVAFLAVALSASLFCGCEDGKESTSDTQQAVTQSASADSSKIDIPGFEKLTLKAGETEQTSPFFNPENNVCLFRLTLKVNGEDIWTSGDIAPGQKAESMTLSHPLDAGEYQAKLKYDCFTLDGSTPLNGAEIDLAVKVK